MLLAQAAFQDVIYLRFMQINLIAPPLYVVTTQTLERQEGLALLNTAVQRIQELIEDAGGVFEMKQAVSSKEVPDSV